MTGGRTIERANADRPSLGRPAEPAAALVLSARQGDRSAFDALVRLRIDEIHRLARAILGHDADAADATQETFVSAWRTVGRLRDADAFDAWLRQIAVNACRQQLRRRHRQSVREVAIEPADLEDVGPVGRRTDELSIEADRFDRAFGCLSVDDRAILVLHHLDERTVADIAATLGRPQGTIKSRLFRARAALESALAKESR